MTAILLGLVSFTTALGAWQAATWSADADEYALNSDDARDASIIRGVAWQADNRRDNGSILEARKYALLEDQAIAAQNAQDAAFYNVLVGNELGRIVTEGLPQAFTTWRADGFPTDESPITDPIYLANLRGDTDAYVIASQIAGDAKDALEEKARIFAQAALIDALALFLFGVAGINRLRAARFATLALGLAAYVASLLLMATAY
ncbi:hypothetical protein BH11ACT3_BH11ACT3_04070 [soil metagenome]